MTKSQLNEILEKHEKWFRNENGGERADLSGEYLRGEDLSNVNLRWANLYETDFCEANLHGAVLIGANLDGACLRRADLREAYLRHADLSRTDLHEANLFEADLSGVNLHRANLYKANLCGANLCGANFSRAILRETDLSKVIYDEETAFFALCCPEKGAFVGFKKASGKIVELLIPEDAKRSSATTRKCRCSKAKVLSITEIDGSDSGITEVCSNRGANFVYKVGETVSVSDFDENRWNECSTGIHFFIARDEAVKYN